MSVLVCCAAGVAGVPAGAVPGVPGGAVPLRLPPRSGKQRATFTVLLFKKTTILYGKKNLTIVS